MKRKRLPAATVKASPCPCSKSGSTKSGFDRGLSAPRIAGLRARQSVGDFFEFFFDPFAKGHGDFPSKDKRLITCSLGNHAPVPTSQMRNAGSPHMCQLAMDKCQSL